MTVAPIGRLTQRESASLTRRKSGVQIPHRPPATPKGPRPPVWRRAARLYYGIHGKGVARGRMVAETCSLNRCFAL